MNNLKKFTTEAEYSSATLNYPAVSWVTSGDTVHFDKTAPVNDKIMMAFTSNSAGEDLVIFNGSTSITPSYDDYFTKITINGVDETSNLFPDGVLYGASQANTDYLVKYDVSTTNVTEWFSGRLGVGNSVDFLIPAQITEIEYIPDVPPNANEGKIVIQSTTPPILSAAWCSGDIIIYVPDEAVNTYKSAWSDFASDIYPISEYSGNLPV